MNKFIALKLNIFKILKLHIAMHDGANEGVLECCKFEDGTDFISYYSPSTGWKRDNREGEKKRSSDDVCKKCNGIIKVIQFPFWRRMRTVSGCWSTFEAYKAPYIYERIQPRGIILV